MKNFFQNLLESFKNLFSQKVSKHQKWLFLSTLIFGLLVSLVLGTISSILLMLVLGLIYEATYYFVPFKFVEWLNYEFKIPDFKVFFNHYKEYLVKPQRELNVDDFNYIYCSIIIFIIVRIIFLIF